MAAVELSNSEIVNYASIDYKEQEGQLGFQSMVEKPKPDQVVSNLANINQFIFTDEIFEYLRKVKPNKDSGEYYIVDAVNAFVAAGHSIAIHKVSGQYLDVGSLEGWLKANQVVAKARGLA
jgi:UTP--glucose-1-phosphate uridylyltransferase